MLQIIKRVKVNGEIHETKMAVSDSEWKVLQENYPFGGVSFSLNKGKKEPVKGRESDDDKPKMVEYAKLKDAAMGYFKEENYEKALYYFEEAYKHKSFGWIIGKINRCKEELAK